MEPFIALLILIIAAFSAPHIYDFFKPDWTTRSIQLHEKFIDLCDQLIAQNDECVRKLDKIGDADRENVKEYWQEYVEEVRKYRKIYKERRKVDMELSKCMSDMDMFYEPVSEKEPVAVQNFDKLKKAVEGMYNVKLETNL